MTLQSVLPIKQGPSWAATVSNQVQEIVTTYNAEELGALNQAPDDVIAWAGVGTKVNQGTGIVKIPVRLPQSLGFTPFKYGGAREYQSLDVAAPTVRVSPFDLNFKWPMVYDELGNAKLMSQTASGTLEEFMGVGGLASDVVYAARAYKAQLVATMLYRGLTSAALSLTADIVTIPQPGNPNGLPFFTNGTDSAKHYTHPFRSDSGRFQNAYPAYGAFASNFGRSLTVMTQKPHPTLPNMTMGLQVTDVVGPTHMRDRFWAMAVQGLSLQTTTTPGNLAAATVNPYSAETFAKFNESNFLGQQIGASGFAAIRYWIAPQLDNHPYVLAHGSDGPGGGPADMWLNICANGKGSWCQLASPSKEFVPFSRIYGPGDPRAQSERQVRMECDLDAGVAAGLPHFADLFFGV